MTKNKYIKLLPNDLKQIFKSLNNNEDIFIQFIVNFKKERLIFCITKKNKNYSIALDNYKNKNFNYDKSISVEGYTTWKDTVDIFLDIFNDYYEETK